MVSNCRDIPHTTFTQGYSLASFIEGRKQRDVMKNKGENTGKKTQGKYTTRKKGFD